MNISNDNRKRRWQFLWLGPPCPSGGGEAPYRGHGPLLALPSAAPPEPQTFRDSTSWGSRSLIFFSLPFIFFLFLFFYTITLVEKWLVLVGIWGSIENPPQFRRRFQVMVGELGDKVRVHRDFPTHPRTLFPNGCRRGQTSSPITVGEG